MLRDHLKDEAYFEEYIKQQLDRILKFTSKIENNEVREDRIQPVLEKIDSLRFQVMIAKYSAGYPIAEIEKEFVQLVKDMPKYWKPDSGYIDLVWTVSIGVMLEMNDESRMDLRSLANKLSRKDGLIEFLLCTKKGDSFEGSMGEISIPPYKNLLSIIKKDKGMEGLKEYLHENWYNGHGYCGWYDIHNHHEKLYFGYWSFESGAIVKILGLDDSSLKGVPYYPYDMVHYKD